MQVHAIDHMGETSNRKDKTNSVYTFCSITGAKVHTWHLSTHYNLVVKNSEILTLIKS